LKTIGVGGKKLEGTPLRRGRLVIEFMNIPEAIWHKIWYVTILDRAVLLRVIERGIEPLKTVVPAPS
jgi:hypothetical protein